MCWGALIELMISLRRSGYCIIFRGAGRLLPSARIFLGFEITSRTSKFVIKQALSRVAMYWEAVNIVERLDALTKHSSPCIPLSTSKIRTFQNFWRAGHLFTADAAISNVLSGCVPRPTERIFHPHVEDYSCCSISSSGVSAILPSLVCSFVPNSPEILLGIDSSSGISLGTFASAGVSSSYAMNTSYLSSYPLPPPATNFALQHLLLHILGTYLLYSFLQTSSPMLASFPISLVLTRSHTTPLTLVIIRSQ